MSNIKNNIEFEGMKVENAVQKIIENSANVVFIVEGSILRGSIRLCPNMNDAKFIYVNDGMYFGGTVPNIPSNKIAESGAEALNNPFGKSYTTEKYKQECITLKDFSEYKMQKLFCCNSIVTYHKFGNWACKHI